MTPMERVSILLPAHNEGPRIAANIERVCATARDLINTEWRGIVDSFEVIVTDDGSADDTWAEIERAAAGKPHIIPIRLPSNYGKGMALRQAYQRASGSWIFFIDADLDIGPEHMAADGFHPGEPVYRATGEALAGYIAGRLIMNPMESTP